MDAKLYKTDSFTKTQISKLQASANKQEKEIARIFWKSDPLAPSQVHVKLDKKYPITSVRRAVTNLTDKGILEKTGDTYPGPYGRPEHRWTWVEKPNRQPQQDIFGEPKPQHKNGIKL